MKTPLASSHLGGLDQLGRSWLVIRRWDANLQQCTGNSQNTFISMLTASPSKSGWRLHLSRHMRRTHSEKRGGNYFQQQKPFSSGFLLWGWWRKRLVHGSNLLLGTKLTVSIDLNEVTTSAPGLPWWQRPLWEVWGFVQDAASATGRCHYTLSIKGTTWKRIIKLKHSPHGQTDPRWDEVSKQTISTPRHMYTRVYCLLNWTF